MVTQAPPPRIYRVRETRPQLSATHPRQKVTAGNSPAGIHLLLTDQAAAQLAHFLIGTTIADPARLKAHLEENVDDPHLWAHVAVDLLTARARHRHDPDDIEPAYAQGGYLRPVHPVHRTAPGAQQ